MAWIAFAYATVFVPIAIAVSISQCFIIITVLLGIFVSHEKLMSHQKVGVVVCDSAGDSPRRGNRLIISIWR